MAFERKLFSDSRIGCIRGAELSVVLALSCEGSLAGPLLDFFMALDRLAGSVQSPVSRTRTDSNCLAVKRTFAFKKRAPFAMEKSSDNGSASEVQDKVT